MICGIIMTLATMKDCPSYCYNTKIESLKVEKKEGKRRSRNAFLTCLTSTNWLLYHKQHLTNLTWINVTWRKDDKGPEKFHG